MSADLVVVVPSRSRPGSLVELARAWRETCALDDAALLVAVDADDPAHPVYVQMFAAVRAAEPGLQLYDLTLPAWLPMVPKLNGAAANVAAGDVFAVGFMGDDHLPRTKGWARAYLDALRELGTGIVYGNDLFQGERLPTQWAMTSDIIRELGRMVPAPVEHLYCDNAVMALGLGAECLRYLPDVVVEHVHPIAGKAPVDAGYRRVNAPEQYRRDGAAYRRWVAGGFEADVAAVRRLREVVHSG